MLLIDAQSVRERLLRAEALSSEVAEAQALNSKRNELQDLVSPIIDLARRNDLLHKQGVPLSQISDIYKVKQLISQNKDRFEESPKAATLIDKQRWIKLGLALTELRSSADTLQKQDWKTYFNSKLFGGLSPSQRKQTIVQALPENQKSLDRYMRLYQNFDQYRNRVPDSAEALREVHEYSNDLASIKFVENDDVPAPVRAFFNAISVGGGSSLDLLTQDVIEWLRNKNMLSNYVVRAR